MIRNSVNFAPYLTEDNDPGQPCTKVTSKVCMKSSILRLEREEANSGCVWRESLSWRRSARCAASHQLLSCELARLTTPRGLCFSAASRRESSGSGLTTPNVFMAAWR